MATQPQQGRRAVIAELRELVEALPHGARLPTERALAERWGVARMTVRHAMANLAREGLVRTVHGSGSTRAPAPFVLSVGLSSFADAVAAQGMRPGTRVLALARDTAPPPGVTEYLGTGDAVTQIRRLRLGDDLPLALECAWLPGDVVDDLTEDMARGSLYHYLARLDLQPDHGEESVRAGLPTDEEAALLGMPVTQPVLRLVRKASHAGRPVEYAEAAFPSDRYELCFPLDLDRGPLA